MTKFGLRTLVYHETVPGHHFQIGPRARERRPTRVPADSRVRRHLGASARAGASTPSGWRPNRAGTRAILEGLLGQLDGALFRARRLVVDTGIHAKRWTRQQAIDYGIEASEVERYVVNPGQACSYMIGQLKIVELREKARAALGSRFSIREFHTVVLATGSVPLELLERQIDAYIQRARG